MFCPHCGTHCPDAARFCTKCGRALDLAPEPATGTGLASDDIEVTLADAVSPPPSPPSADGSDTFAVGKSPLTAFLLSVIPGMGLLYCGEPLRGLTYLVITVPLLGIGIGLVPYLISAFRAMAIANGQLPANDYGSRRKPSGFTKYQCPMCHHKLRFGETKMRSLRGGVQCRLCGCNIDIHGKTIWR